MTLETFFERFDQFLDAPNAVAQMRNLVLQWAAQGRLVRQDPTEHPATQLIRDAVVARTRLVNSGVVRDSAPDLTFLDQVDNRLPLGWVQAPLSVYVGVIMGQSPPSSAYNTRGDGLPFYQGKAQFGRLYPTATEWCSEPTKVGEPGDVVISVRAPVGPTNMLRERSCIGRGLASLRSLGGDQMHLLYTLRAFERSIATMGVGSTFVAISKSDLDHFQVPIPPLSEQKRIVAKVEELMALCDRLEAQQQERETRHAALARASLARFADAPTPANLSFIFHPSYAIPPADLRKSILTLAVQGKLVPQDPNDTTASEMLASDAKLPDGHVRRRKIMKRAPIASRAEMFPGLPPSWVYADVQTLYDLNMIVDYADGNHGSLYPRSSEFGDSGVRFVTARDIANGRVSWEGCARLNEERANQLTKGWARGGDVLLTHNATVGRVAKVEREIGRFLLGTSATFYRLNEQFIDPGYFYHVLCSPTWQSQLGAIMEQTTRNQVSIQKQAYFQVPIAPLAEQRRIVAKVEQLMTLVDALETQLAASRTIGASLAEAAVGALTARS